MTESVAFDRAAGYYDETRGFPEDVVGQVGDLLVAAGQLMPESRVIEIGIGTGRIALPLGARTGMVAGVDLAPAMLARLLAKRRTQPVFPVCADAVQLPYAPQTFDAAVAVHVFHLIPDWRGALRALGRVLKPGGVLLQAWNAIENRDQGRDPLWTAWDAVVGAVTARTVGVIPAEYDTFLTDNGWQLVRDTQQVRFTRLRTPAVFLDRLERRVWSSMWRLPDELVEQGLAAVRARIDELGLDMDKPAEFDSSFNVQVFAPPPVS